MQDQNVSQNQAPANQNAGFGGNTNYHHTQNNQTGQIPSEREFNQQKESLQQVTQHNLDNTHQEPHLYQKTKEDIGNDPTAAPMQLEGQPDISKPSGDDKTIICDVEIADGKGGTKIIKEEFRLSRMTVAAREAVTMYTIQMLSGLNMFNDVTGRIEPEKARDANYMQLVEAIGFMRQIAPYMTGRDPKIFQGIKFSDMLKFMNWLFENETGLVRTVEDFLAMQKQDLTGKTK